MQHPILNKTTVALLLTAALGAAAHAQQSPLGPLNASGTIGYESQYVFRGKKISNSTIQPKAEIGISVLNGDGNIYGGAWANEPVSRRTNAAGADQADEVDLFGGFMYTLPGGIKLDLGDIYYWYPDAGGSSVPTPVAPVDRSDETYLGLSLADTTSMIGINLTPSVYFYHDWFLDSNTVEGSLRYVWDVSGFTNVPGLSLVPQATAGWTGAHQTWGDQIWTGVANNERPNWRNSYVYWLGVMELDYKLNDFCTIYLSASYAGNNDGKQGGPAQVGGNPQLGGSQNNVFFGAGFTFRR